MKTEKEKIQERLNSITELLKEKQEQVDWIESQQRTLNEKFAAMEIEKLELLNSFQKLTRELDELGNELQILEQKILEV